MVVCVIDDRLDLLAYAEQFYRWVTALLDRSGAPAEEWAALVPQRAEIEGALDELKTHVRGAPIVLGIKTPDLVRQEFEGLLLLPLGERKAFDEAVLDEILRERVVLSRGRRRPRGVTRKMSNLLLGARGDWWRGQSEFAKCIRIVNRAGFHLNTDTQAFADFFRFFSKLDSLPTAVSDFPPSRPTNSIAGRY
jgi:hypothetical protein